MEIIQRRLLSKKKTTSLLPKGYRRVEYIKSTGGAYINTGKNSYSNYPSFKFTAKIESGQATDYTGLYVFGNADNFVKVFLGSGKLTYINGQYGGYGINVGGFGLGEFHEIELEIGRFVLDGVEHTFTKNNKNNGSNIYLFKQNSSATQTRESALGRFQLFTGKTEPVLVRDFVPCYRESDGVVGMYDLCGSICPLTNTPFYINAGEGEFLKGDDV